MRAHVRFHGIVLNATHSSAGSVPRVAGADPLFCSPAQITVFTNCLPWNCTCARAAATDYMQAAAHMQTTKNYRARKWTRISNIGKKVGDVVSTNQCTRLGASGKITSDPTALAAQG